MSAPIASDDEPGGRWVGRVARPAGRQSALCVPSHTGWWAECLQAQNQAFFDSVASYFTGVNSEPLCEPSQNGCFALLPQAHHQ